MTSPLKFKTVAWAILLGTALSSSISVAGPLRDWVRQHRAAQQQLDTDDGDAASTDTSFLPPGAHVLRNISYGDDARQRFDVYLPAHAANAPVIFMVHGGGWKNGDKAMSRMVKNKAARWVPKGFIFISTNYRMLPDTRPLEQAQDVARAVAAAQGKAASWGGDRTKFILMGHSAGAHLVALLAASPTLAAQAGAKPWLGTVALDSAAFGVEKIMQARHMSLYDPAFGDDPDYWKAASPFHVLQGKMQPFLAVYSTRRDDSASQAKGFVEKASSLGTRAQLLGEDMSHREINERLGEEKNYTEAVEAFMRTLDGTVAGMLAN